MTTTAWSASPRDRTAITRPAKHVGYRTDGQPDQVLAAGPDLVGIVVAVAVDTDLNTRRLDRGIVMAYESGALPLVILTKADLAEDLDLVVRQADAAVVGVDVVVVSPATGLGVAALADRLSPDRAAWRAEQRSWGATMKEAQRQARPRDRSG